MKLDRPGESLPSFQDQEALNHSFRQAEQHIITGSGDGGVGIGTCCSLQQQPRPGRSTGTFVIFTVPRTRLTLFQLIKTFPSSHRCCFLALFPPKTPFTCRINSNFYVRFHQVLAVTQEPRPSNRLEKVSSTN